MRLDYTITVDDLRQAARPTKPDGQPLDDRRLRRGLVGWVVVAALAVGVVYVVRLDPAASPRLNASAAIAAPVPARSLWPTLLPGAVPAGLYLLLVCHSLHVQLRYVRRAAAAIAGGRPVPAVAAIGQASSGLVAGMVAIVGVAIAVCNVPALAVAWRPTDAATLWVGFAPWIVVAVIVAALAAWANRVTLAKQWSATPAFHRPLTADVSDAGVRTSDGVCDTLHRWPMVTRYRETDDLLVLSLEDARTLILPLRAVAGAEDQLRGLVQTHVAEGTFRTRPAAFPVVVSTAGG